MKCYHSFSLLLLLLAGCQSPDLKPFADSTANLHQAVVRSQHIVQSELHELRAQDSLKNEGSLITAEKTFTNAFAKRIEFMEAVVGYSDSLAAVADAGKNGRANAQALGDSVKKLADAAGPYGAAVGVGADIFAKIYGLAAQGWAVHSLREATVKADPIIKSGAEILQKDFENIGDTLTTAETSLIRAMEAPNTQEIAHYNNLKRLRADLIKEVDDGIRQPDWNTLERVSWTWTDSAARNSQVVAIPDIGKLGKQSDDGTQWRLTSNNPTTWQQVDSLTTKSEKYRKRIDEVNAIVELTEKWYLPLQSQESEAQQRLRAETQLMDETVTGFKQWAKVHADLERALQENRQPDIRALVSTVLEIKAQIETLKNH